MARRFVATCHRLGDLRWLRVDGTAHASLDDREPFCARAYDGFAGLHAAGLDGYKGESAPAGWSFFCRV